MGSLQDDILPHHRMNCLLCPICKAKAIYCGNIDGWMLVDCAIDGKVSYNVLGEKGVREWEVNNDGNASNHA